MRETYENLRTRSYNYLRTWAMVHKFDQVAKGEFRGSYQKIKVHGPQETFEHFMIKAAVGKELSKMGHGWGSEVPLRKKSMGSMKIDIYDYTAPRRYEVVVSSDTEIRFDDLETGIIDVRKMPVHLRLALTDIQKWVRGQLV